MEKNRQENFQEQKWASVEESGYSYQESLLPFHPEEYYEDGIWNTWLDWNGNLISYARNDRKEQWNQLLWKEGKQIETVFPPEEITPKKLKTGYLRLFPCRYGKENGYIMYKKDWEKQKNACYVLDAEGKIAKEISLQKYLDKNIEESEYEVRDIRQLRKNRICVMVSAYDRTMHRDILKEYNDWDSFYLLEINVQKNKLAYVHRAGYWILGADSNYLYGVIGFQNFIHVQDFRQGASYIVNRENGQQIGNPPYIPDDVTTPANTSVSQCFDIRDGYLYLANRTGVYRITVGQQFWERLMKPEDSKYLNENYTLTDITVVNENKFYLMFLDGDDDETATVLSQYERKI